MQKEIPHKNCVVCGKIYYKKPNCGNPEWSRRKYCSHSCQMASLAKTPLIRTCAWCGKEFRRQNGHPEQKYCSIECSSKGIDWGVRPQSLYNPNMHSNEKILCACGCGTEIPKYDKRGRPRKYASGHTMVGKKRPKTPEQIEKQRQSLIKGGKVKGKNHPNWKGGISDEMKALRKTPKYDEWRFAVYKRDHYTCQYCKKHCASNDIIAHHLEDFRYHKELRYDTNNGITLCRSCHLNLHRGVYSLSKFSLTYRI